MRLNLRETSISVQKEIESQISSSIKFYFLNLDFTVLISVIKFYIPSLLTKIEMLFLKVYSFGYFIIKFFVVCYNNVFPLKLNTKTNRLNLNSYFINKIFNKKAIRIVQLFILSLNFNKSAAF